MAIVEVTDVTFAYGDQLVLDDVSITIDDGEFLGLVGPNGSGKTTLLEVMIGLRRPDSGSVRLFGEPAHVVHDDRIGYVQQDVTTANRKMPVTVKEVVQMGRYPQRLTGRFRSADTHAVKRALNRLDISDLAGRRVGELSGGQRQRVFIARALAAEADLLALDEPTVGIDADSRAEFYALLHALNEEGLTIILIEHDIGVITSHVSEIACLNRELFFHGDPETFVEVDALAEAYGAGHHVIHHDH